jgi:L-malate glycosyltransferase
MNFCTVFPDFESVHMTKDVGMIPYALAKTGSCSSSIIYWRKDKSEMRTDNAELWSKFKDTVSLFEIYTPFSILFYVKLLCFILSNKVTVVNLYHFKKQTYLLCFLLRLFKVNVYVKFDIDNFKINNLLNIIEGCSVKSWLVNKFIKVTTLFSVESKSYYELLSKMDCFSGKLLYLPNGIHSDFILEKSLEFHKRKNKILVVGRLGEIQKNHELIFNWLATNPAWFADTDWTISFAGPANDKFMQMFHEASQSIFGKHIEYLGNLSRKELFNMYATSKIFLMTSLWEASALSMTEASIMGLYLVSTDVGGFGDLTKNGTLGRLINENTIDTVMADVINGNLMYLQYDDRLEYAYGRFLLDHSICPVLNRLVEAEL